jgi:hypothetical protein
MPRLDYAGFLFVSVTCSVHSTTNSPEMIRIGTDVVDGLVYITSNQRLGRGNCLALAMDKHNRFARGGALARRVMVIWLSGPWSNLLYVDKT